MENNLKNKYDQFRNSNILKDHYVGFTPFLVLNELYGQKDNWVDFKELKEKSNLEFPSTFGNKILYLEADKNIATRHKKCGRGKEAIISDKGKNLVEVILGGAE